jgi:ubiquinone/menaquinone biosynthesis C-methylase UbiE
MDRKTYMKNIYWKYWLDARENRYGFSRYDENLCGFIQQNVAVGVPILEVALGTGYPIADFLQSSGYQLYGSDISYPLVKKAQINNPSIHCSVGDAEELPYPEECFALTYCFHSTWYFPNLTKAIDEMIRVTRSGGYVIFDIQNRNAKNIAAALKRRLRANTVLFKYAKNVFKLALRRGSPDWHCTVYEVPAYPETVCAHLSKVGVTDFDVMARSTDDRLQQVNERGSSEEYGRLIFVIRRPFSIAPVAIK